MSLNKQQIEAINHFEGYCMVTSVPGSGKTRTLVERTIKLIEKISSMDSLSPGNILNITFTNKAAKEMKERLALRLGIESLPFYVGTFHALCVRILRKFGDRIGYTENFSILDANDQFDLVSKIVKQSKYDWDKGRLYKVVNAINSMRENMSSWKYFNKEFANDFESIKVAKKYIKAIKDKNCIDFSGLLSELVNLLENHPDVLDKVQRKFRYIQVDEFQDTNKIQFHIIRLFAQKSPNDTLPYEKSVFVVGDINQSVYGWRGARYQNIQDFVSENPSCKVIHLSLNYRSTPEIISPAAKLIRYNTSFMGGDFVTENKNGEDIRVYDLRNQYDEAEWVSQRISRLISDGGWKNSDIAILYRMNSMSEPIERALSGKNIAYEVIGSRSFYDRKEVRDCLAILKLWANRYDSIAFDRVCKFAKGKSKIGLGDATVNAIEEYTENNKVDLIQSSKIISESSNRKSVKKVCSTIYNTFDMQFSDPKEICGELITRLRIKDYISKTYDNFDERIENINQLMAAVNEYISRGKSIQEYLQMISLLTAVDKDSGDNVSLMTLHAAKGLEFPIVFIIGFEQGILPHNLAVRDNGDEGLEEERRLAYVGMTRAKKVLYLSYCQSREIWRGRNKTFKKSEPSTFLIEAGLA